MSQVRGRPRAGPFCRASHNSIQHGEHAGGRPSGAFEQAHSAKEDIEQEEAEREQHE
jgi:hypothetical protein